MKNFSKIIFVLCLLFVSSQTLAAPTDDFVITVKTDNAGTSALDAFTIPTSGGGYDYNVDCNDDGVDEFTAQTGNVTCDYSALGGAGTYTIRIEDNVGDGTGFPRIYFNNGGDKDKILSIEQWGTGLWTSMQRAFYGAINMLTPAIDVPDFSSLTSLDSIFRGATLVNPDTTNWNTTGVTNMRSMFRDAIVANPNTINWDTSMVGNINSMFFGATSFNQDLSHFDMSSVTTANLMFDNSALSTTNYDLILTAWDAQTLQAGVVFGAGTTEYCLSREARLNIENTDNWVITDGGKCDLPTDDFVITVKTDNAGTSAADAFIIPTSGGGYDYNVDCNDDGVDEFTAQTGNVTCDYSTLGGAGTYTIRIKDNSGASTGFPRIFFNNGGDKEKILSIEQWGIGLWTDMSHAFSGAANLVINAIDTPDLTNTTSLLAMFRDATSLTGQNGNWNWNTLPITSMDQVFSRTTVFDGDVSGWRTDNVADMDFMFFRNPVFNQDLSNWNTEDLTTARFMFDGASSFDQDLSSWNVEMVDFFNNAFRNASLSTLNYDKMLIAWNAQSLQANTALGSAPTQYCFGEAARTNMVAADNWNITDNGKDCASAVPETLDLQAASDTGASNTDDVTTSVNPSFDITCSVIGNVITLYSDNPAPSTVIGSHTCTTVGTESLATSLALPNGAHNVSYTEMNGADVTAHSLPLLVTINAKVANTGGSPTKNYKVEVCEGSKCIYQYPVRTVGTSENYSTYFRCINRGPRDPYQCTMDWVEANSFGDCDRTAKRCHLATPTPEKKEEVPEEEVSAIVPEDPISTSTKVSQKKPIKPLERSIRKIEETKIKDDFKKTTPVEIKTVKEVVSCAPHINNFLKKGGDNSVSEVRKLQSFLSKESITVRNTGIFGQETYEAVIEFQEKYSDEILRPWGIEKGTGWVYKTTLKKINDLWCESSGK